MLITVFWEDQRGPQPKAFGPHALLLACLSDDTGLDRWDLATMVVAIPKKGDTKLKAALARDAVKAANAGPVVFVFDNDRVRELLGLSKVACKPEVIKSIGTTCEVQVAVVLLENNVEDLLNACRRAAGEAEISDKLSPNERDAVFYRAAIAHRATRDRIRMDAPSFDRLVRYVRARLPCA